MDLFELMLLRAEQLRTAGNTDGAADLEEYARGMRAVVGDVMLSHGGPDGAGDMVRDALYDLADMARKAYTVVVEAKK